MLNLSNWSLIILKNRKGQPTQKLDLKTRGSITISPSSGFSEGPQSTVLFPVIMEI